MTTALITGCTGQDGSYLVEFLLAKGYEIYNVDLKPLDVPGVNTLVTDRDALAAELARAHNIASHSGAHAATALILDLTFAGEKNVLSL